MKRRWFKRIWFTVLFISIAGLVSLNTGKNKVDINVAGEQYLSPTHICYDGDGIAYISLSTAGKIAVIDSRRNTFKEYIQIPFNPGGIVLDKGGQSLLVADKRPEGKVHFISLDKKEITKSINVGHTPDDLVITPDGRFVFAGNRFTDNVSVIDLDDRTVVKEIDVERDPKVLAISPDGLTIAVANNIPDAAATDQYISARITLINRNTLEPEKHISLANGSHSIEGLAFSKDGTYLYASHILSRNNLPTSQIEHGWINSNAVSVIDIDAKEYVTSVLLDSYNLGAANPSGMLVSKDGSKLIVALSGVHELCSIDLPGLHEKLDVSDRSELNNIPNDLRFLYGLQKRVPVAGKSPRHIAICQDKLLVSSYFSPFIVIYNDLAFKGNSFQISLGNEPDISIERRGEMLFCDADLCFQKWQSCISCHPDARVDGLNWDLLNDGAGNPKNGKSLLFSHYTPPVMITGIRKDAETAVRAGIRYILFTRHEETDAQAIDTYLKSLRPVPSPYLMKSGLSDKAKKGKNIFESAGCGNCHSGKYFTDGKKYDVGTGTLIHKNELFDVPGLKECWRTAPYLYDGRAKTMMEVFTDHNTGDKHGVTGKLSGEELDCLVEYILSL